jgi:hypothetical protein
MLGPDDRGLMKGPCVQYLYGSRVGGICGNQAYGMTEAICEVLEERGMCWSAGAFDRKVCAYLKKFLLDNKPLADQLVRRNFYKDAKPHVVLARNLAAKIYATIESAITCAKVFRDFIESIAGEYIKHGKEFRWNMHGFPVLNIYLEPETKRLSLRVDGQWYTRRRTLRAVVGDSEIVRGPKAFRAASPNFVHSLDGCHNRMVILAARADGTETIPIHDCWAAIAPRAKRLNEIMRSEFITLHRQPFVAELLERAGCDLPKSATLPSLPKMRDFESTVEPIRYSFHAFK